MLTCTFCGASLMSPQTLPLARFTHKVYAVDSVETTECLTEGCESGGGYTSWECPGLLCDLVEGIDERPLYVKFNHGTRIWERVTGPEKEPDDSLVY